MLTFVRTVKIEMLNNYSKTDLIDRLEYLDGTLSEIDSIDGLNSCLFEYKHLATTFCNLFGKLGLTYLVRIKRFEYQYTLLNAILSLEESAYGVNEVLSGKYSGAYVLRTYIDSAMPSEEITILKTKGGKWEIIERGMYDTFISVPKFLTEKIKTRLKLK